jgi:transposase
VGGDRAALAQEPARRVDGRRVISGILHVLKVGCRWGNCPAEYGPSTTVYNRFNRWSQRASGSKLLDALVGARAVTKSTAIDSTYGKAQRGIQRKRGRSRGGWTTKVHALTDIIGRPYALMLTAGNASDIEAALALLQRAGRMRCLLAGKGGGYDTGQLLRSLRDAGAVPVTPGRRNRKRTIRYDKVAAAAATSPRTPSAARRTSAVSLPATPSSPPTSYQACRSPHLSPSGCERV